MQIESSINGFNNLFFLCMCCDRLVSILLSLLRLHTISSHVSTPRFFFQFLNFHILTHSPSYRDLSTMDFLDIITNPETITTNPVTRNTDRHTDSTTGSSSISTSDRENRGRPREDEPNFERNQRRRNYPPPPPTVQFIDPVPDVEDEGEGGDEEDTTRGNKQPRKYGIEYVNPKNLEKVSSAQQERDGALGREDETKENHQNQCIICLYGLFSGIKSNCRIRTQDVYPLVESTTWVSIYQTVLSYLEKRDVVGGPKKACVQWNEINMPSLNYDNPDNKPLLRLTPALVYDHYRYYSPTEHMRSLYTQIEMEEIAQILVDKCGVVKRDVETDVYYVDTKVSSEVRDWLKTIQMFSAIRNNGGSGRVSSSGGGGGSRGGAGKFGK